MPAAQEHCSPEMVERLSAIIRAQQAQVQITFAQSPYPSLVAHATKATHVSMRMGNLSSAMCPCKLGTISSLQGEFADATLLDISDVELVDIKFLDADPVIVVQFNCQQVRLVWCFVILGIWCVSVDKEQMRSTVRRCLGE